MEHTLEPRADFTPRWHRFKIGELEATIVSDGRLGPADPVELFPKADPGEIEESLKSHGHQPGGLIFEMNCLVLRMRHGYALFDTGLGSMGSGPLETGQLLVNLRAAGIDPAEVRSVVLTHAHDDHCSGLVDATGTPTFPDAEIVMSRTDFDYWTGDSPGPEDWQKAFAEGARRNLHPYLGRMRFVAPGDEVLPSVRAVSSAGHSIGHTSYAIASQGARYLFLGDVVHSIELQLDHPDWPFFFDYDSTQAARTRNEVFQEAIETDSQVIGYHFPFPGLGQISRTGAGFAFTPTVARSG